MSEYTGRMWICSCGWKGPRDDAYEHAEHDCRDEHPQVGPRYHPDRVTSGEQSDLARYS